MVARLTEEFLVRCEQLSHRMVDVAEAIAERPMTRRICDQMVGCGTSVGANLYEADEAMSRKEFVKFLAIASRELSECRFWLRFVGSRAWLAEKRLEPLLAETMELRRILGTMIARTKGNDQHSGQRH